MAIFFKKIILLNNYSMISLNNKLERSLEISPLRYLGIKLEESLIGMEM